MRDLSNRRFGLLRTLYRVGNSKRGIVWQCICDCGNIKAVARADLTRKDKPTISCGCHKAMQIKDRCWKGHGDIPQTTWASIIAGAKIRNIAIEISIEEAWSIFQKQNGCCFFTKEKLFFNSSAKKHRHKRTASLDRIDSSKGYTIDNVCWVHKRINIMKNKLDNAEFIEWCKKVAKNADKESNILVAVSGYFNPIHSGHLALIREARKLGDKLVVIVNNDMQVGLKGSIPFMSAAERAEIVGSLKEVDHVVISHDTDRTVCKTLSFIKPAIFANGGDATEDNCLEKDVCSQNNIKLVYGVGGYDKAQSSSRLLTKLKTYLDTRN